jgi:hypothetical protein
MYGKLPLALTAVTLVAAAAAVLAVAGPGDPVPTYTGCLSPNGGTINNLAAGDDPLKQCNDNSSEIRVSSGDVTSVSAGTGLIGGGDNGDLSLSVDPTQVQTRVTGHCLIPGGAIEEVNEDGSVECSRGPRGVALVRFANGSVPDDSGTIGSLALASGNWLVFAKVALTQENPQSLSPTVRVYCELEAPDASHDVAEWQSDTSVYAPSGVISLIATVPSGAGASVKVNCTDFGSSVDHADAKWSSLRIAAFELSDLVIAH